MVPLDDRHAHEHDRRRWDVVRRRDAARGAGRIRRRPGRCVLALHTRHGRLRARRPHDGSLVGSLWRHGSPDRRFHDVGVGLYRLVVCHEPVAARVSPHDPDRHVGLFRDLFAVDCRRIAMVHAQPRHRHGHRRLRQLSQCDAVGADRAGPRAGLRLASDACHHRPLLSRDHVAAGDGVPAPAALSGVDRRRCRFRWSAGRPRNFSPGPTDAADCRWHRMLRRHVDAASAHRCLLRRSRIRRGARRGDAVVDDGLRHRQPAAIGLDFRLHRRPAHAGAWLTAAGTGPAAVPAFGCPDVALRGVGPVRPVPGRHHSELCADRARILSRARGRHAHRPVRHRDHRRHGAGRLAVGGYLRPDRQLPGSLPQRHRLERSSTSRSRVGCCGG